jgi:hypothetical protein
MDIRTKVAAGLLVGVLSLLGVTHAAAAAPVTEIRYSCDGAQRLVVFQTANGASVQFIDRSYQLRKARSSIGQKYISPNAALIIDGRSAVFVADDRLQLGQCLEADRTASAL